MEDVQVVEEVQNAWTYIEKILPSVANFFIHLVLALLAYYIGTKVIKWVTKLFRAFMERSSIDEAVSRFLTSLLKAALYFFLIVGIAVQLGVKEASIVAIIGSAGVGVSLALQGGLSNLAGGVLILILKPFQLGDYIIQSSQGNEGTVVRIDMFYTTLNTVDNRKIVIPNSLLTNNSLINVTAKDERKLEIKIGISYQSDLKRAKAVLEKLLLEEKSIMSEEEHVVFVDELAESSVIIGFRAWVATSEYWTTKWRLNEQIKLAFDAEGIEIPYNQLDVHLR